MRGAGILALAVLAWLAAPAWAEELRGDLFNLRGERTGYVIIDQERRRLDFSDRLSRRTGSGVIRPDVSVEVFALQGRRTAVGRSEGFINPRPNNPEWNR